MADEADEESPLVSNSMFSSEGNANTEQPNTLQQLTKKLIGRGFKDVEITVGMTVNLTIAFTVHCAPGNNESMRGVNNSESFYNDYCEFFNTIEAPPGKEGNGVIFNRLYKCLFESKNKDAAKAYIQSEGINAEDFYAENSRGCCNII